MGVEIEPVALARLFERVLPELDERQRRLVVGSVAEALGRGGQQRVTEASGMSSRTVSKAAIEVRSGRVGPGDGRVRRVGGGDKPAIEKQPGLLEALDELVDPDSRGTPLSGLRWTGKSVRRLARELRERGFVISAESVRKLLHKLGYSLQANAKTAEGSQHPDRDGQFRHIAATADAFMETGDPVISVDTKKKELVGDYANGGREWQPVAEPERVAVHDFPTGEFPKAIPYGVYDLANDEGWVSVGETADTAEFAVASIRRWWLEMGAKRFPNARRLLICCDAGGSNGYRVRAWKWHLAQFAAETGLEISVCHYPPGTSKWNKIEHRMFSFITINWRGRPLTDIHTIVNLIAATTTDTGLSIRADYDPEWYPTGVKITNAEFEAIPIQRNDWHGEWNYTIATKPSN